MKRTLNFEPLVVEIYDRPDVMGRAAAEHVEKRLNLAITAKGFANLVLATGTSQFMFLDSLKEMSIDWQRINVFHLDEYIGIPDTHPASFRKYLKDRILDEVKPARVYLINGSTSNLEQEILRYENALRNHPIDIACIGIGENGHIAFNDPPVADFKDPELVKVVTLDEACRNQQLGEGWFDTLDKVPKKALTLTIPAIMNANAISCVVPDQRKANAVFNTLNGEISTNCPASILRNHPDTVMFLDTASASMLG